MQTMPTKELRNHIARTVVLQQAPNSIIADIIEEAIIAVYAQITLAI